MKNLKNNFYKIIYFFQKASGYWTSGKRHEVIGTVQNAKGLYNIFFCIRHSHLDNAPLGTLSKRE